METQALATTTQTTALQQAGGAFGTFDALERFGAYIYQSGMFGVRNPAEGFIVGITCQQENMTLMQFKERYHLIQGQVAMKSEAMLANLLELGGSYEVIERTPERAALKITYKKASFLSELKWEDAQKEDYTKGRNGQLKDNWSTPRRRMQMMWARAVSDGVRAVCPLATRGHYTPEEAVDFDELRVINAVSAPATYPQQAEVQPAPVMDALPPEEPQTVTPPTAPAKTPAMFRNDGPEELDYTICKIDGPMKGIKWAEMPIENLKLALEITNPALYEQDKVNIREVIKNATKGEAK